MSEAVKKEDNVVEFMPHRMSVADNARNIYQVTVDPSVERKHLTDPKFWKHVAPSFQPYTRLEVVTDDSRFFCELLVLNAGKNWATVKELRYVDLGDVEAIKELPPDFYPKWRGPVLRWCAMRASDNEPLKEGMQTQEEAISFIKEYSKAIK